MPEINKKTVEVLAGILKVDQAKLSEQLVTTETDEAKMETKISEVIPKLVIRTAEDDATLMENTGKQKYKEGKLAGEEMLIKEGRKKLGLPESVSTLDDLVAKAVEAEKKKSGTPTDERVTKLESEKATLQALIETKDAELVKAKSEVDQVKAGFTISSELERAAAAINIDAPAEKISNQREVLITLFKQKHDIRIEDGKQVVYRNGKQLVDGVLKPISVADALKEFAPAYVNVKTDVKGRGDQPGDTQLDVEVSGIKDKASFVEYLKKKNITDFSSTEALAIYREVKKKNPSLQF